MAADKSVAPEFGPNGAVLNSPNMTEEMREAILGSDPTSPSNRLPRPLEWLHATITGAAFCVMWIGFTIREREPIISVMLTAVALVIVLANQGARFRMLKHLRGQRR